LWICRITYNCPVTDLKRLKDVKTKLGSTVSKEDTLPAVVMGIVDLESAQDSTD